MNGDELFAVVETYHGFGTHRAGTDVDRATAEWFAGELGRRGLVVDHQPVAFDRYVFDSELTADGEPVDHLPLFYEWTGSIDTTDLEIVAADAHAGGRDHDLDDALATDRTALVVATDHAEGSLVGVNRKAHDHHGRPTVLVAGRDHHRLVTADTAHLSLSARIEPGETTNLFARHGGTDLAASLVLTTPLTGWFGCAGERGTGIAVLLDLIDRFADHPIVVLATGAHELDYLGVRCWVADAEARPRAIAHVGASVAVEAVGDDGARHLARTRLAMTDRAGADATAIERVLAPAAFHVRTGTDTWLGESEVFCELDAPMLSFTGSGVDFHTPEDTPVRATSPRSLATVAAAIGEAVEVLWRSTD